MRSSPVITFSPCGPYRNTRITCAAAGRLLRRLLDQPEALDVALVLEDPRDLRLQLAGGHVDTRCLADTALRRRVSMSEIGSVISLVSLLAESALYQEALRHAGDVAFERQLPEAQAAHVELPHERPRPAAQLAAVALTDLVLRRLLFLGHLRSRGHLAFVSCLGVLERHAHQLQQACALLRRSAVVTTDTFMPRALSTFM